MIIDRKDSSYQKPKKQEVEAENLTGTKHMKTH